jgi:UDP-glucuronate decarboxylase
MHPNDGRVVSNFIVQALKQESLTIFGSGQQTRSFCYVDDMIGAFELLMGSSKELVGPVNLGNPVEFSMLELAEKIKELTGSSSRIEFCDLPQDDPRQRQPDITLAKDQLNWSPAITLDEGLIKTIGYFDKII